MDELGLFFAEGKMVAAEAEFDGVAEGGPADDFDGCAIAETHFEQSAADVWIAANGDHATATAGTKGIQFASGD